MIEKLRADISHSKRQYRREPALFSSKRQRDALAISAFALDNCNYRT